MTAPAAKQGRWFPAPSAYLPLRISELGLALMIAVPFSLGSPHIMVAATALGGLLVLVGIEHIPRPPRGFVTGLAITTAYVIAGVAAGKPIGLIVGNSNHFLVFLFALFVFHCAFRNGLLAPGRIRRYLLVVIAAHVIAVAIAIEGSMAWLPSGTLFLEHTLLSLVTFFALAREYQRSGRLLWGVLASLYLFALLAASPWRGSLVALSLASPLLLWRPLPATLVPVLAVAIITLPLAGYIFVDTAEVWRLQAIDFNSYIRAEFIRGALSELRENWFLGIGFGEPFRPITFGYLTRHPLLVSWEDVTTVSNHHSIFDTYLRFGLIFGTVFCYALFIGALRCYRNVIAQLAVIYLAFGLSFNAWLENALQTSCVAFLIAFLAQLDRERVIQSQTRR